MITGQKTENLNHDSTHFALIRPDWTHLRRVIGLGIYPASILVIDKALTI